MVLPRFIIVAKVSILKKLNVQRENKPLILWILFTNNIY